MRFGFGPQPLRYWIRDHLSAGRRALENSIPTWSTLRTLGQSRAVGATMLVPFLGTLVLFNQTIVDWLRIPQELLTAWGWTSSNLPDPSLARLKLTYFGLCFVGVGSFTFSLLCPKSVKQYGTVAEFVRGDDPIYTGPRLEGAMTDIVGKFASLAGRSEFGRTTSFLCPWPVYQQTFALLREVGAQILREENEAATPPDEPAYHEEEGISDEERESRRIWADARELTDRSMGGIDVDKLLDLIFEHGSRMEVLHYEGRVGTLGREHKTDVMALTYVWDDHRRAIARLVVSSVFALGFSLLAIPTLMTFWAIARQLLG